MTRRHVQQALLLAALLVSAPLAGCRDHEDDPPKPVTREAQRQALDHAQQTYDAGRSLRQQGLALRQQGKDGDALLKEGEAKMAEGQHLRDQAMMMATHE